jgi:biopolymer transport protein ExbD
MALNFQRDRPYDEPEVNLIPMIDVLLVIVIFLAVTTTYSKYSELKINLPTAEAETQQQRPNEIDA